MNLSVDIGGLTIRNPIMMASGTFGHGAEYANLFYLSEIGGVVTKTITRHPRAGNPPPRTAETPSGMLNSIGLTNPGLEGFIEEKIPALEALDTGRVVSIAGTSSDEFAEMADTLCKRGGFDALELNVSSPNMKDGGMLFGCREEATYEVTKAVKAIATVPVFVKLTPNVTDITAIAKAVEDAGADGIAMINTLLGMAIDIHKRTPILGNITGGLSGPAIKPVALALTWKVAQAVSIPIVGMGGITTPTDAVEFLIAGATAVQVGTATFVNPTAGPQILNGLTSYCQDHDITDVNTLIGSLQTS